VALAAPQRGSANSHLNMPKGKEPVYGRLFPKAAYSNPSIILLEYGRLFPKAAYSNPNLIILLEYGRLFPKAAYSNPNLIILLIQRLRTASAAGVALAAPQRGSATYPYAYMETPTAKTEGRSLQPSVFGKPKS